MQFFGSKFQLHLLMIAFFFGRSAKSSSSEQYSSTLRQRHPSSSSGSASSPHAPASSHPMTPPSPQHMRVSPRVVEEHHREEMKEHVRRGVYNAAFAGNIGYETFMDHYDKARSALIDRMPGEACRECQRANRGAKEGACNFVNILFFAGKNAHSHFQKSKSELKRPHTLAEFAQKVRDDHTSRTGAYIQIHEQNEAIRQQI